MTKPMRLEFCVSMSCVLWAGGCATDHHHDMIDHHKPGTGMKPYIHNASDPQWLAEAAGFHGHLGPWSTIGAMIGRDARRRLSATTAFDFLVVCWLPPNRRVTPVSCIMDGLQVSTGATMGKRNIRFAWDDGEHPVDRPEIHVIHLSDSGLRAGVAYQPTAALMNLLRAVNADNVEQMSRRIAGSELITLLAVRELAGAEIERALDAPARGGD